MDRSSTRPTVGAPPDPSCYSPVTIATLERWQRDAFPTPSPVTMDAVCDTIESLCLAASLDMLPCCGVAWVDDGDDPATLDYRSVNGHVEIVAVTTTNF